MEKDDVPRFLLLLQPNRDLAANWAVDVAQELESYLSCLSLTSSVHDEGHDSLNFAEAALLIQGSIQIYSRKVEYLYNLVLQALEFIAQKKETQHQECSIQENGKDTDIVEDEDEFLNLDDVPEEKNIDLIEEDNVSSCVASLVKPPACLLVAEGDNLETSGDAGELASYQISTSCIHRDFLLLDPCDAKYVDEYWKANQKAKDRGVTPLKHVSSVGRSGSKSMFGHENVPNDNVDVSYDSAKNQNVPKSPGFVDMPTFDNEMDDWHEDDGGNISGYETKNGKDGAEDVSQQDDSCNRCDGQHDDFIDPWAPLNPHEPGTLPIVPYKRGRTKKKMEKKKLEGMLESTISPHVKVWEALACLEREIWRADQSMPHEKLRSSFTNKGSPFFDNGWSSDKSDDISGNDDSDDDALEGDLEPDNFYEPDLVDDPASSQEPSQQASYSMDPNMPTVAETGESCLEDLCQAQLDAIIRKHSLAEQQSELTSRVTSWKQKIERNLAIQDSHPPFDIHFYCENVLEKLSSCEDDVTHTNGVEASFTQIVEGLEKHEVARTFAALLQLVNNGNVALETGNAVEAFECFTAERPFSVKLLSSRRRHEEMLHYKAPSSRATRSSGKKKKVKGTRESLGFEENIMGGFDAKPLSTPHSQQLSGKKGKRQTNNVSEVLVDSNKCIGTPKSTATPEGKRRKRKQTLVPGVLVS